MSKKIYSIISILISIILIFSLRTKVFAASATMSASSTKIEPGKTVTITADIKSAASWQLDVSTTGGTLKKNDSRVGNTESGNNEDKTVTLGTFTTDKEGTYKITLSGYVIDGDTLSKTDASGEVSIVVENPPAQDTSNSTTNNNSGTTNTQTPQTPAEKPVETPKSTEARLSNFGIRPNDFKGFKKDTYEYTTSVPNEVTEVEIYGNKADSKATVEGLGKVSLKEGNNTFEIKVTAEDGKTTKTYKLTIKRKTAAEEESENGETRLKSLSINPEEYDFSGFDSEKTEYAVKVPNEIKEIEIVATAKDSRAQITGIGIIELDEGKNDLKIEVIAVNGEKKTYTLEVTREEAEEKVPFGLSTLKIDGLKLTPSFKVDTYEYNVELTEDLTSLEIQAESNDEDATVEIIGNENIEDGENVITIQVRNKEKDEIATYQIIVNKNLTVEEVVAQMSWLKPETWGKEEIFKLVIILVLIVLIICAVLLKISIGKENKKAKKVDFPGAEELDKAIAEHQELSEEPVETDFVNENVSEMNYQAEVQRDEVQQNYIEEIAMDRFDGKDFDNKPRRRGRHF